MQLIFVALLGGLSILSAVLFVLARVAAPGDGTQVILSLSGLVSEGLVVNPFAPTANGLQSGDIVIAIDGHTVNDLIRDAYLGSWNKTAPSERSQPAYSVLRDGQPLSVTVTLAAFPFVSALQESAGLYLTMLFMAALGTFVFLKRPYYLPAQLFFLSFITLLGDMFPWTMQHQTSDLLRGWVFPFETAANIFFNNIAAALLLHLFLVFPRRHPLVVKYPKLIVLVYLGVWLVTFVPFLAQLPMTTTPAALLELQYQTLTISGIYCQIGFRVQDIPQHHF